MKITIKTILLNHKQFLKYIEMLIKFIEVKKKENLLFDSSSPCINNCTKKFDMNCSIASFKRKNGRLTVLRSPYIFSKSKETFL